MIAAAARRLIEHLPASGEAAVAELVGQTVPVVAGAQCAGFSVVSLRPSNLVTLAATGPEVGVFDAAQNRHGRGPSLVGAAAGPGGELYVPDLTVDGRWPQLASEAATVTELRSVMVFEVFTTGRTVGVVAFYGLAVDAFDEAARDLGFMSAAQASMLWHAAQRANQFAAAIASRDVIGQAKGMLMERFDIDADRAFRLLSTLSQDQNIRLHEIARRLLDADHPPAPTAAGPTV